LKKFRKISVGFTLKTGCLTTGAKVFLFVEIAVIDGKTFAARGVWQGLFAHPRRHIRCGFRRVSLDWCVLQVFGMELAEGRCCRAEVQIMQQGVGIAGLYVGIADLLFGLAEIGSGHMYCQSGGQARPNGSEVTLPEPSTAMASGDPCVARLNIAAAIRKKKGEIQLGAIRNHGTGRNLAQEGQACAA
jgi:hypothetical protein